MIFSNPRNQAATTVLIHQPDERFDTHQVDRFRDAVSQADGDVVIDLGRVRFLDAAAMNALVEARAALIEAGAELWLDRLSQTARITLELAGLSESFPTGEFLHKAAA